MNIREILYKIKGADRPISFDSEGRVERLSWLKSLYLSFIIILACTLSFGMGRLTSPAGRAPMEIRYDPSLVSSLGAGNTASVLNAQGLAPLEAVSSKTIVVSNEVVASSKGTKYHYSHCPGAKQISEKNKITFTSTAAAEAAGYTLAANCQPK